MSYFKNRRREQIGDLLRVLKHTRDVSTDPESEAAISGIVKLLDLIVLEMDDVKTNEALRG